MPTTTLPPHRVRDDRGFMLIEVLVSAVILVTASLAIFTTLTRADGAAGQQQHRVEAANFAQSELERIRSLPVQDIMSYAAAGNHKISRNGVLFTETVEAKWVSDGSDEPECTGQEGGLDFMRTTVTISWPTMGKLRPVTLTTLITPNAGAGGDTGSLSVHVIDRDGKPVQYVVVNINGKTNGGTYGGTTNQNGCVVFGFIPQDAYALTAARDGYVDQDSNPTITDAPQVTAATTTKVEYSYDAGGTTAAKFQSTFGTCLLGICLTQPRDSYPPHFQIWHAQQTFPGGFDVDLPTNVTDGKTVGGVDRRWIRQFGSSDPQVGSNSVPSWDARNTTPPTLLYPFSSPYTVYAGNCPANAIQNSAAKFVNISRAQFQNTGAVDVPAVQVQVYSGSSFVPGQLVGGARVMVNFGCGTWVRYTATSTGNDISKGQSPWGIGTLGDPGFPYSTNTNVCAYDPGTGRSSAVSTIQNTNVASGVLVKLYMNGSGSTGGVPAGAKAGDCQA